MLNYKQIWHGIKPIRWLNKFNLTQIFGEALSLLVVICSCWSSRILYDLDGNCCLDMLISFVWAIFGLLSCLVLSSLDNVGHWLNFVLDVVLNIVGQIKF